MSGTFIDSIRNVSRDAFNSVADAVQNSNTDTQNMVAAAGTLFMGLTVYNLGSVIMDAAGVSGMNRFSLNLLSMPIVLVGGATLMHSFATGKDVWSSLKDVGQSLADTVGVDITSLTNPSVAAERQAAANMEVVAPPSTAPSAPAPM